MTTRESNGSARDEEVLVRLMVEYQAGRLESFEGLYDALAADLRRHFDTVSHDGVAQDLVQETFLEIHRSRRTYLPPLPVRPWVFGVARNVLRRHRRVSWRRTSHEQAAVADAESSVPSSHRSRVEGRDVAEALTSLPDTRRRVWELHHVHGFSFEEIARMLRIPVGAAKLRSSRAMGALRSLLGVNRRGRDD